jgi:hypothetical protein
MSALREKKALGIRRAMRYTVYAGRSAPANRKVLSPMQCAGCGQSLTEGVSVCLRCGTPVPPGYPAKQVDVALLPDPVPPSGDNWSATFRAPPTSPYQHYDEHETVPPPPPSFYTRDTPGYNSDFSGLSPYGLPLYQISKPTQMKSVRRLNRWMAGALVALVCLLSLGIFAYAHAMGTKGSSSGGAVNSQPAGVHCGIPIADETASRNLINPQLTTGLRDVTHKNFSPIDTVNTFKVGQTVYFTFTVGSNQNAAITAEWCWGQSGNTSQYNLSVNRSAGQQGYFDLRNLDSAAVGTGVLVVRWNDAVAYVKQFYVSGH